MVQATFVDRRQQLAELLDHLIQERQTHSIADRRGDQRESVQAPVVLGVLLDGRAAPVSDGLAERFKPLYRGWVTDLSPHDLGMLLEHDLPVGAEMAVRLDALLGQRMVLPLRIAYCKQLLPHTYRVGATFV